MNNLESIRKVFNEYLEEASQRDELMQIDILLRGKDGDIFRQMVYDAFFNLIADHTQTSESIIHQLEAYTSGLDSFSTNRPIQTIIAYACLQAIAQRKPKVLKGSWETLVWIIVKYSGFASTNKGMELTGIMYRESNIATVQWITDICSQESCPNPCLRMELFRFLRCFNCRGYYKYQKLFCDKVTTTLSEICDNYTSLTISQLPYFSPPDLHFIMKVNKINIKFFMNDYDLHLKQSEIIVVVLKLCRLLALLEKEKQLIGNNQAIGYENRHLLFKNGLSSCLSFCGLIRPPITGKYMYIDKRMNYFIKAIDNDSLLLNHMIDTLDTITKVSLCFPEVEGLKGEIFKIKGKLLRSFFDSYIRKSPKNQYLREINGGNTQAKKYHLRYFQNNMVGQGHDYQDWPAILNLLGYDGIDFEEKIPAVEFKSDEENISDEDISGEENISNEEDTLNDENMSDEEYTPDEGDISDEDNILEIDSYRDEV